MQKEDILTFERAITESGKVLVPRTSININTVRDMTEEEKKDMLALLEHAKEIFRNGSKHYIGGTE